MNFAQIKVYNIDWDEDGVEFLDTDIIINIPLDEYNEYMDSDDETLLENYITDKISDITGYCHNGWDHYIVTIKNKGE